LQGNYPPSSSFKPAPLLAALGRGVTTPTEVYNATGTVEVGGTVFRDWTVTQGLPPAGPVDAVAAMERSVNDYFYTMGMRAGILAIADTAGRWAWALPAGWTSGPRIRPASCRIRPGNAARCWKSGSRATRSTSPSARATCR